MILDALLKMSAEQALTTVGSVASTNVIDLAVARDMGIAHYELKILARVHTAFTSGGSATLVAAFQGSTDNSTFYTMSASTTIALASLTAGSSVLGIDFPRPVAGQATPRYIRMYYTVGTADFTAGTIDAYVVVDRRDNIAYPSGITITN